MSVGMMLIKDATEQIVKTLTTAHFELKELEQIVTFGELIATNARKTIVMVKAGTYKGPQG